MDYSLTLEITLPILSVGAFLSIIITIYSKGRKFYFELERYIETIIELIIHAKDKSEINLINTRNDLYSQLLINRKKRFFKYGIEIFFKSKARHKIAYEFFSNFIFSNIESNSNKNTQVINWIIQNFLIKYKGNSTQFKYLDEAFSNDFSFYKDQYKLSLDIIDDMSIKFFEEIQLPYDNFETLIQSFKRNKTIKDIKNILTSDEKYKENILLKNFINEVRVLVNQIEVDSKKIINIVQEEKYIVLYFEYFSNDASLFIKNVLEKNCFTKIYRRTAYIKLIPNSELKKFNYNLLIWLKNKFELDFEEIHKKGGGFFFVIKFEIQDFLELKFNFEFEPKLLFNSLKQQIINNDNLFLKLLDLNDIQLNSKIKKIYPIDFLQIPRAFVNCSLNRNYSNKDFIKILHDCKFSTIIVKSEDFEKISEEELRECFSLSKSEYEQLKKSLKALEVIKDGHLDILLNSE